MSEQSSRGPEWDALRLRVLDRDEWTCVYCGKDLVGKDATADHVIPKDLGGEDIESNLVACCRADNGRKGNRVMIRMPWFNPAWLDSL